MYLKKYFYPFDHKRFIGYVTHVAPDLTKIHFPSSPLLKRFNHAGETLEGGLVGSYIAIEGDGYGFIGKLISVTLPEKERMSLSESAFQKSELHPTGLIEILLSFDIYDLKSKKGLDKLPPIGAKAYACSNKFLNEFLQKFGKNEEDDQQILFDLASLPQESSSSITVVANSLFQRHCAIVGTTGGGKSYTLAKLLEEIIKNKAKAIIIDATGEFKSFNSSNAVQSVVFESEDGDRPFLHYNNLYENDLFALFKPSSQSQAPKLQEAIKSLKIINTLISKDILSDNEKEFKKLFLNEIYKEHGILTINKEKKDRNKFLRAEKTLLPKDYLLKNHFDINSLPYQIKEECIYSTDNSNSMIFGSCDNSQWGYCQSLISRINLFLQNEAYKGIFGINKNINDKAELNNIINEFIKNKNLHLLRISLENIPYEGNIRAILVNCIGRILLQKARKLEFRDKPLILFIDEAHQFFDIKIKDEYSLEIQLDSLDCIAKECRKYGLYLTISTQRPRDMSQGTMSQIGTFIVHRLININDRESISSSCAEANKYALSFLPILEQGQALLIGVDFPMPLIIKIQPTKFPPESQTPTLESYLS